MLNLRLFGTPSLDVDGETLQGRATQRRRIALLTLLAATPGHTLTRDKLVGWLWPEHEQGQAKHLLAVSLYEMRKALGDDTLISQGDDVVLASARVWIDVAEFEDALMRGELRQAVDLYTGPFLDGFHISDAAELGHWMDARRDEYQRRFEAALEELADARTREGDVHGAVEAWHRLAAGDPYSTRFTLGYMHALERVGDHARALRHARIHESLLKAELDAEPDPVVTELAERIRSSPQPVTPSESEADVDVGEAPEGAPDIADTASQPVTASSDSAAVGAQTSANHGVATKRRGVLMLSGAIVLAAAAGVALPVMWPSPKSDASAVLGSASIAVLPFVPMSAEADGDEYFRDGLTDEIINALARVEGINVVSRTSSFVLGRETDDIQEVGRKLGVATVLEGSVRRRGDDVRIAVNLVSTSDRRVLWSNTYVRSLAGLFSVQEAIARGIVEELSGQLTGEALPLLVERPTEDLNAYEHYLRGRYYWEKRTPDDLVQARSHFERAVEIDTAYVMALAGLSDVYNSLAAVEHGVLPPAEAYQHAEAAAAQALRLDSTNANAHAAYGNILLNHYWDLDGAKLAFRRALDINPGYVQARHWYSLALLAGGQPDSALEQMHQARMLDPLSVNLSVSLGRHYYLVRDVDEAIRELRHAVDLDGSSLIALMALGMALEQAGDIDGAVTAFTLADQETGGAHLLASAFLGHAFAKAGQRQEALAVLERLSDASRERFVPPEYAMIVHLGLGEFDKALDGLEEAARLRSGSMIFLDLEPLLDPLRSHPRFTDIQRAVRAGPSTSDAG